MSKYHKSSFFREQRNEGIITKLTKVNCDPRIKKDTQWVKIIGVGGR